MQAEIPEIRFLSPVQDASGVFFFALSAPVHLTLATKLEVEQAMHCAMARQMHKWFELDTAFETAHDVSYRFASDLEAVLQSTAAAARIEPCFAAGPDRRAGAREAFNSRFGAAAAAAGAFPVEVPNKGYPHRWRLHGIEFREATGRFAFRVEPWPMRKLKLLPDVRYAECAINAKRKVVKVESQNENKEDF